MVVTKDGKGRALLIPINEDTDIETLVLSNSRRFWQLFDKAGSGERTRMEDLPAVDDDAAWAHFVQQEKPKEVGGGERAIPHAVELPMVGGCCQRHQQVAFTGRESYTISPTHASKQQTSATGREGLRPIALDKLFS